MHSIFGFSAGSSSLPQPAYRVAVSIVSTIQPRLNIIELLYSPPKPKHSVPVISGQLAKSM